MLTLHLIWILIICSYHDSESNEIADSHHCLRNQYGCPGSDKCFPIQSRCRHGVYNHGCDRYLYIDRPDCGDRQCPGGEVSCDDGKCVPASWFCDGRRDCLDRSDEHGCVPPASSICFKNQFPCADNKTCIRITWRCDNNTDCPDDSDEMGCEGHACPEGYRHCDDGVCVQESLFCDGKDDCEDRSDEQDCDKCENWGCFYFCEQTSLGPRCLCPEGFELDEDKRSCKDVDECQQEAGACDQICTNTLGSFICSCQDGYELLNNTCAPLSSCLKHQFKCFSDSECIPIRRRCDGHRDCCAGNPDCSDESDEEGCVDRLCPEGHHRCDEWRCWPSMAVCDGREHCEDGSDEKDCESNSNARLVPPECPPHEAYFPWWIGFEGAHCPPSNTACLTNQFPCKDGVSVLGEKCVPISERCDGVYDCVDGSDEEDDDGCRNRRCSENEYRCVSGQCIPETHACDAIADCEHAEDEKECDIDECQKEGTCDQICTNTIGSFRCSCQDGYELVNNTCAPLSSCLKNQFKCSNSECIPIRRRCDGNLDCCFGNPDCSDDSDEVGCVDRLCPEGHHRCDEWRCWPSMAVCDGRKHCEDGSDERYCVPSNTACLANQFPCKDGVSVLGEKCVPISGRCDGVYDCVDGSDEDDDGCRDRRCSGGEYRCPSGQCIPETHACDALADCEGAEDEKECVSNLHCLRNQYECPDGSKCVPIGSRCLIGVYFYGCDYYSWMDRPDCATPLCPAGERPCADGQCLPAPWFCDGQRDCRDNRSDETDCVPSPSSICLENQFLCSDNKTCVRKIWRCDGSTDCPDGSDEIGCEGHVCPERHCRCDDGDCKHESLFCDGKPDCDDRSDERDCDKCENWGCLHFCNQTSLGPRCVCVDGFELNKDKRTCKDIDECQKERTCDQVCTNTVGSFICSCYEGYELVNNNCRIKWHSWEENCDDHSLLLSLEKGIAGMSPGSGMNQNGIIPSKKCFRAKDETGETKHLTTLELQLLVLKEDREVTLMQWELRSAKLGQQNYVIDNDAEDDVDSYCPVMYQDC